MCKTEGKKGSDQKVVKTFILHKRCQVRVTEIETFIQSDICQELHLSCVTLVKSDICQEWFLSRVTFVKNKIEIKFKSETEISLGLYTLNIF